MLYITQQRHRQRPNLKPLLASPRQKRGLLSGLDQTGGEKSNISMENDKFQPGPERERSSPSQTEACVWRGELKRPPFFKYEKKNKARVKKMSFSVPRNKRKQLWTKKKKHATLKNESIDA